MEQDSILSVKFPYAIDRDARIYLVEQGAKQYAVDLKTWLKYLIAEDVTEVPQGIEGLDLSLLVENKLRSRMKQLCQS